MAESVPIFPTLARKVEFFDRLGLLLDEFPEIASKIQRTYDADPTDSFWTDVYGEEYKPNEPFMRHGIVVVLGHTNLSGWGDTCVLEPEEQPRAMTIGLLVQGKDNIS